MVAEAEEEGGGIALGEGPGSACLCGDAPRVPFDEGELDVESAPRAESPCRGKRV